MQLRFLEDAVHVAIAVSMWCACSSAKAQVSPGEGAGAAETFDIGLESSASPRVRPSERVTLSLQDGDLNDLIRLMTQITGRRFVVTGTLRQIRATIASDTPVTAADAYRAFVGILHQNGLAIVRRGRHYAIIDNGRIAGEPTEIYDDEHLPPDDERFITWIHHVAHIGPADAAALLDPLRSSAGQVLTHAPTRLLILIDTGANVRRMRRILSDIDVPSGDVQVWLEPLRHADAEATAEQLRAIFSGERAPPTRRAGRSTPESEPATAPRASDDAALVQVLAEPRLNALILVGTEAAYRRALAIVRALDRRGNEGEASVRVHRLQHGDAQNVAATLQRLLGGGETQGGSAGPRTGARVEAHADLNALVITATPAEYRRMRQLVEDLDAAPRQVFLEMVLMELTVDRNEDLGVNVLSGITGLGSDLVGMIAGGGGGTAAADLLTGIAFGVTGPLVQDARLPGGSAPSFGVLVHALARSSHANILSTPHILVLDNREAVINVGQNVPLQGSAVPGLPPFFPGAPSAEQTAATAAMTAMSAGAAGGRRDTGTIVHVTPHINDAGEIRLEIQAEDSRQGEVAQGNLGAVALNQSIAQTELVVRDGETAVIGGLMRESHERIRSGVPFLSEIPVLGALFGQTGERSVRRNLLFFVTPYVVRGPSDMRAIYERRLRERRELRDRYIVLEGDWEPGMDYSRTRGLVGEILDCFARLDEEVGPGAGEEDGAEAHPGGTPIDR